MAEITVQDVEILSQDSSPEMRSILAQKLGRDLDDADLNSTERDLAMAICRKLAEDVEVEVRRALSTAIQSNGEIPKEIALSLAQDVADVALPILELSPLLDDEDLVHIVREGDKAKQLAISHRAEVSEQVTDSLVQSGDVDVVDAVLENQGAKLSDQGYDCVLDRFSHEDLIQARLIRRPALPTQVVERLVEVVSDHLKAHLIKRHNVSSVLAEQLILESKVDAKKRLMNNPGKKRNVASLVEGLAKLGRLTDDLIFRAIEVGDRAFFEQALASRAGIDLEAARTLIKDPGYNGFRRLYDKCDLPKRDFQPVRYMVDVEYFSGRHKPITEKPTLSHEPDNWLTQTEKPKKKGFFF